VNPPITDKQLAQLSERKTVHEWLNALGIPQTEFDKPICLLRRLSITVESFSELVRASREMDLLLCFLPQFRDFLESPHYQNFKSAYSKISGFPQE
jgi:hypothetical protein